MRRLLPTARSFLIHSGQAAALAAVAVLAMAAAPASEVPAAAEAELPVPEAPPVTAVARPAGPMTRLIAFATPLKGYAVNSAYGLRRLAGEAAARQHKGIDIAAPRGTSIFVASEGEVVRTGYDAAGYGRFIEVRHPNGMSTLYAHLSRVDVARGDRLGSGERIGLVGSTGRSTGPHLHFEVRRDQTQVNPTSVLGQAFEIEVEAAA
ncbi:M23 family metallopeptidase [Brevundimonas sp.]|uniref:M23 family metallopeptidase n=2 Tax=Brevundimonas sp. TaxID=1871086 RepID=UPI0027EF0B8A|nr:M23 family metallopeptidase [Brevundimonas sp.]MDQ7813074.1 M23 family metallopeptidase [Brevundimonas sp.]